MNSSADQTQHSSEHASAASEGENNNSNGNSNSNQARNRILDAVAKAMGTPPIGLVLIELYVSGETGVELDHTKDISDELQARVGRCISKDDVLLNSPTDRLIVIKRALTAPAETEGFALRLLNALGGPVRSGGQKGTCHPAIGVAVSHASDSPADLLRYAEHALGDARMLGGDMVVCFEDADRELLAEQ